MPFLLFLTAFVTASLPLLAQSAPSDEQAIKTVIERETQAYLNRDAPRQADCWASHTDLSQQSCLGEGRVVAATGNQESLRRGLTSRFRQLTEPDRSTFTHSDFRIRIRNETAFVTFQQRMQCAGRPDSHSYQIRYLEREADEWKIVYSGVMYDEPKPNQLPTQKPSAKP